MTLCRHLLKVNTVPTSRPAALAFGAYLLAAVLGDDWMPLAHHTMFVFSLPQQATVVPYFLVNGHPEPITDYDDFEGIGPDDVDVTHVGFECSVEHKLFEQRAWLAEHARGSAPAARQGAPVPVELGFWVMDIAADGRVSVTPHPVATGTARVRQ